MSQQTRIDQFYPSTIFRRSSVAIKNPSTPTKRKHRGINRRILGTNSNLQVMKKSKKNLEEATVSSTSKSINIDNNAQLEKIERTPEKKNSVDSNNSLSNSKSSSYSPKVSSAKSPKPTVSRRLFSQTMHDGIMQHAIENMNLLKLGAICPNNFNLVEVYSRDTFHYEYNRIDGKVSTKYELQDIITPTSLQSKTFITIIFDVLSNPVNCGYFDESEMDFIYSIFTLPAEAQDLLSRIIKRKRGWFRQSSISYPEISPNLTNAFNILVSRHICTHDIQKESLSTMLDLLQANESRHLCQVLKLNHNGKKNETTARLLKLANVKPLFAGVKNPNSALYAAISDILKCCVRVTDKMWNIFDKIMTLLIPNQDYKIDIQQTLFMLSEVYVGKLTFPNVPPNRFPVFPTKFDLLNYLQAKSILSTVHQLTEKKNWEEVRNYGNLAMDILSSFDDNEWLKNCMLPVHVRYYMKGYMWMKVLSKSLDAFKKLEDKTQVVKILKYLVEQNFHMLSKKGTWYGELALIEMFHRKNVEESAVITIQALEIETLTRVDKIQLIERANKIRKKKTITPDTRTTVEKVLNLNQHQMQNYQAPSNTIQAVLMRKNGALGKSIWCIQSNAESQSYGSVELLALNYYGNKGFSAGLHCEGSLPITLFFISFWEELFHAHIPGAFVTPYQYVPGDLYTEHFYKNRKEKIDQKLHILSDFNSECLSNWMEERYIKFCQYQSAMPTNLFNDSSQLKEIVCCIGTHAVSGICKRLLENYRLWTAGFPDLIVWNPQSKQHKIVEVKGPKDTLSTKQQLWLEYLNQLGLNIEVCLVQDMS